MPLKFNVAVRDWFEGGLAVGNGGVDRLFEGFRRQVYYVEHYERFSNNLSVLTKFAVAMKREG